MYQRYAGMLCSVLNPTTILLVVGEWSWRLLIGGDGKGGVFTMVNRDEFIMREPDDAIYSLSAGPYGVYRVSAPLLYKDFFEGPAIVWGGIEIEKGIWLTHKGVYNYRIHAYLKISDNGMVTLPSGKYRLTDLKKKYKLPKVRKQKPTVEPEEPKDKRKLPAEKIKWRKGTQKRDQRIVYSETAETYLLVVRPRKYPDDPKKIRVFDPLTGNEYDVRYYLNGTFGIKVGSAKMRASMSAARLHRMAFSEDTLDDVPLDERFDLKAFGFPGYVATRGGRIWSKESYQWMTPSDLNSTLLNGVRVCISRIIAQAFIPNPHGYAFVIHKNDLSDNSADNLAWAPRTTEYYQPAMIRQESAIPEIDQILQNTCGIDSKGKLSLEQIANICTLIRQGLTDQLISLHTGQLVAQVQAFRRLYKAMCAQ